MEQKNLNRLRVIIAEKNLTNKWLSEQLGVGQATVSNWVQNNAQPNLEMLIKISKILNVDINELIRPDEVQMDRWANPDLQNFVNARGFQVAVSQLSNQRLKNKQSFFSDSSGPS